MDKTTKLLLTAIAVALFMNALNPWLQPKQASADVGTLDVAIAVGDVAKNVNGVWSALNKIATCACRTSLC